MCYIVYMCKQNLTKKALQAINFSGDKGISFTLYPLHDLGVIGRNPAEQILIVRNKIIINCAVPENIHTHPMEGHWKSQGGGGLKSQNC